MQQPFGAANACTTRPVSGLMTARAMRAAGGAFPCVGPCGQGACGLTAQWLDYEARWVRSSCRRLASITVAGAAQAGRLCSCGQCTPTCFPFNPRRSAGTCGGADCGRFSAGRSSARRLFPLLGNDQTGFNGAWQQLLGTRHDYFGCRKPGALVGSNESDRAAD